MKDGGYLMIDHRASPGIPEDVAQKIGLDPKYTGEGKLLEAATLTCSHCKCAVIKNPLRTRDREFCRKCYHYICDLCAADMLKPDYQHLPFEAHVDNYTTMAAKGILGQGSPLGSPFKLLMPDEPL